MALPLIGAVATIGSSLIQGLFGNAAAKEQTAALDRATNLQREQYDKTLATLQPAISAGNTAREYQLGALGLPGGNSDAINAFRASPGYDFALKSGKNAVQTSAAAGGRLFSGGTIKALNDYGQGMADQEFGNWYGRLGGLSGSGDAATGRAVDAGSSTANNLASLAVEGGNDRASSYIRTANSLTGGIQNLADLYAYYGRKPATAAPQAYTWGGLN